jgi:hypothetical protein
MAKLGKGKEYIEMVRFLNRFVFGWYIFVSGIAWAGYAEEVQRDLIDFKKNVFTSGTTCTYHSPLLAKFKEGTTFRNIGSKIVVFPQDVNFSIFRDTVEWEFGMPGYLEGRKDEQTKFNFDMLGNLKIKKDVSLLLKRVTEGMDDDAIILYFEENSPTPEIIQCGKIKKGGLK